MNEAAPESPRPVLHLLGWAASPAAAAAADSNATAAPADAQVPALGATLGVHSGARSGVHSGALEALACLGWSLDAEAPADLTLWHAGSAPARQALLADPGLPSLALDTALVVAVDADATEAEQAALLRAGAEAVCLPAEWSEPATLHRVLRHALCRKRLERAARTAYATDLATGLPHQAQLIEHMAQLLALREREPAPMVLLVLRMDGFAQAAERLGAEAGNVLRRKVAVRLRAGLRASDVVAAIGPDAFGVLLGRLESKGDGPRVAAKLQKALQAPLSVAGQTCRVSATVGLALYPDHGKDAQALLQRASAQAGSVATQGSAGFAAAVRRAPAAAANDPV